MQGWRRHGLHARPVLQRRQRDPEVAAARRRRCRRSPSAWASSWSIRQFVAETFTDDTPVGKRELFHDPELDFHVLAHVQEGGKTGKPHSHGTSWAIYGNAKNLTEMTEYRRVNPESEENVVLERVEQIRAASRPDPRLRART